MIGGITGGERGINRHVRTRPLQCTRTFPALYKQAAMSLLELGPIIFGPKRDLIDYLQNKRLIVRNMQCQRCLIYYNNEFTNPR